MAGGGIFGPQGHREVYQLDEYRILAKQPQVISVAEDHNLVADHGI